MPINPEQGHFFESGKVYSHSVGLSCCFRQWRATSHCRFLHGYALKVEFTFGRVDDSLDDNNWVANFGGLKHIKNWLEETFDHKTLVAMDDPQKAFFHQMAEFRSPIMQLTIVESTGCEAFAKLIFDNANRILAGDRDMNGVFVKHVRVWEHESNFAGYGRL